MTPSVTQLALLTVRETQVVALLLEGLTNKGIARKLGLSAETVKDHLKRIYHKLEVSSRIELINQARDFAVPPSLRNVI
jgi:LuxR family maltose regulon positive regulatory protein